jgi:hypothetical protein
MWKSSHFDFCGCLSFESKFGSSLDDSLVLGRIRQDSAEQVAQRHHPEKLPVVNDWKVPVPGLEQELSCFEHISIRSEDVGVGCHTRPDRNGRGVNPVSNRADDVSLGENPDEIPSVDDRNRTVAPFDHAAGDFEQRRIRPTDERGAADEVSECH